MEESMLAFLIFFICIMLIIALTFLLYEQNSQYRILNKKFKTIQKQLQTEMEERSKYTNELSDLKTNLNQNILHDYVTGLPGKKIFVDRLNQALSLSKRHQLIFVIVYLEIDEFKMIDNVFGEQAGELVLKELVLRISSCTRKVDTLSRFDDNLFVLLLPLLAKAEAAVYVVQRLFDVISEPFHVLKHELYISANIGISAYPHDGEDEKILLNNADVALQQAKLQGKNIYQFYRSEMYALSKREVILNSGLRGDSVYQEFVIYYQPVIHAETKQILGMEALLRWQHPDLGLVGPFEFLLLAENNGTIIPIGEWVLRSACQQFQQWKQMNFHLGHVSVNVSMRQLENPHFTFKVSQILQEINLSPSELVLDISENLLIPRLSLIEKTLHMLKHLGVRIAIDDFGAGNLSLKNLRKFSIDYLKIDGSLIQDMTINKESEAIVKMIIALASSLQISTIAEGVETVKQKELLQANGCFFMQGFLFSVPRVATDFSVEMLDKICKSI